MTQIRAHASEDGYLYGIALADEMSAQDRYWHPAGDPDCAPCTVTLWDVPEPFGEQSGAIDTLLAHGSSEQFHSDGYEAMNYLRIIATPVA